MIKRFLVLISITIVAVMILGCGGGTEFAPEGSEITFSSGDMEISDGGGTTFWDHEYVTIFVKNGEGLPLSDVSLVVTYPWAAPSPNFPMQLYDGDVKKDSPMTVKTDENGAYTLYFGYQRGGGVEYYGYLSVVSGTASASVEFKVSVPSS